MSKNKTILIAPLDWGLGHATRCIPLIRELVQQGMQVIVAADRNVELILKEEFPLLTFIHLSGYNISYSRKKAFLPLKIFVQFPKMLLVVYREHKWLKKIIKQYSISAVISDNRFGLYHSRVTSVFVTHQLQIKTGNKISDAIVHKINSWFIKKYTECWVPDFEGQINIAGELSHPKKILTNVKYIGCLSRFDRNSLFEKLYDLLIIISGPEPQRSIFEKMLYAQLSTYNGSVLFVRGLPENLQEEGFNKDLILNKNIIVKNHLDAKGLCRAIQQSKLVISRSGYTTVMDLLKLQQKAILVPTPGQTEQEYLAKYLLQKNIFYTVQQHDFILNDVLTNEILFQSVLPSVNMDIYKPFISQFVESL